MKRQILRPVLFLLLLVLFLSAFSAYFLPKGNTLEDGIQEPELYAFLGEPENSLEAVVLGEDEYFLMGDNRSDSTDSRRVGAVERGEILGKAVGVVYPFTEFGSPYANAAG